MADAPKLELIGLSLKTIKALRAAVGHVFEFLGEGLKSQDAEEENHRMLLQELQQALVNVNARHREFDTLVQSLGAPTGLVSLENSGLLSQDTTSEAVSLYQQLIQSQRWLDKAHEVGNNAAVLLTQNSLKRSNINPGISVKRSRKLPPTSHIVPTQAVDNIINNVDRLFPDMSVTMTRPMGTSAILQITLSRTLKAVVVLRSLIIEHVTVKAYHEELHTEDGKLDIWSGSRYKIFQRVSDNANAAALHFYSPLIPDLAIKSFMTWLHSLSSLFEAPCRRCGLYLHDSTIPTWRDFRSLEAYHEACRA